MIALEHNQFIWYLLNAHERHILDLDVIMRRKTQRK